MEEQDDLFSKKIGNKEGKKSLTAKPVVVQGKVAEPVYQKGDKEKLDNDPNFKPKIVGRKLVLICKHPDKDEPVRISQVVMIVGKTVKNTTMWINVDVDGNIEKGSIIATLLEKNQVETVNDLVGKTLNTEIGEDKYLSIKAY